MHIRQAEEEKAKKEKEKRTAYYLVLLSRSENYIIELFINFKINFILKHLLLYPNE